MAAVRVSPTYGSAVIPVNDFLFEAETLTFQIRTAVAMNATPDFHYTCGVLGRRMTNDFNYGGAQDHRCRQRQHR